jgi:hypothetical protein
MINGVTAVQTLRLDKEIGSSIMILCSAVLITEICLSFLYPLLYHLNQHSDFHNA